MAKSATDADYPAENVPVKFVEEYYLYPGGTLGLLKLEVKVGDVVKHKSIPA